MNTRSQNWTLRTSLFALAIGSLGASSGCSASPGDETEGGMSASAANANANAGASAPGATAGPASDPRATAATLTVLANLQSFGAASTARQILVAQQEADVATTKSYGLSPVTSDVETITGELPAMISYEVSNVYSGSKTMFDPAGFRRGAPALRDLITAKHKQGILVSLVWHMRCPKASSGASDRYSPADCPSDYTMEELLEKTSSGARGKHFDEWRAMQAELADLLFSLKDDNGDLIPVVIRPFHEFTGNWFWWGRTNKPAAYQQAWREMVSYLRDARGLHNVLWVFCPDKPTDAWQVKDGGDFEKFYPGDRYVDVIGFDRYDFNDGNFAGGYQADIDKVGAFATAHKKIAAVTEVGMNFREYGVSANPTWFSKSMLSPLVHSASGKSFSYLGLWRNAPWEKYMAEANDGPLAADVKSLRTGGAAVFAGDRGDLYAPVLPPASSASAPICASAASDPDGDGWGWENGESCIVRA